MKIDKDCLETMNGLSSDLGRKLSDGSNMLSDPVKQQSELSVLVIDDDLIFGKVLERQARRRGMKVTHCKGLSELANVAEDSIDVIVLDYFLSTDCRGIDIAMFLPEKPVLLTSGSSKCLKEVKEWPQSITKFIHKKYGAQAILNEAADVFADEILVNTAQKLN